MKETTLQTTIMNALNKKYKDKIFIFKPSGNPVGMPDIVGWLDHPTAGHFGIAFEVKLPDGHYGVQPIQEYRLSQIRKTNACVGVITSIEDAVNLIDAYVANKKTGLLNNTKVFTDE